MDFWKLSNTSNMKREGGSTLYTTAARLAKQSMAVAAALTNVPKLVPFLSSLSFVAINFHSAQKGWTAWHLNGADDVVILNNDNVWSVCAAAWDHVAKLEVLLALIHLSIGKVNHI